MLNLWLLVKILFLFSQKWVWCLLALHSGPAWNPSVGVQAQTPPSNPATVEAQAKYFQ